MMDTRLDTLQGEGWKDCRKIVLFGYGRQGKRVLKKLKKDFKIIAIVENDAKKCMGGGIEEIPIVHFSEALLLLKTYKVIVTVSEHYYREIKKQLEDCGLIEYRDFVMSQQFIVEWYFKYKRKIYMLKTDISVTPKCSLNCEKCTLFMPYWTDKREKSIDDIKRDIDSYFNVVDYVMDMNIVGGEPFLYRKLGIVLDYIGERYGDKVGYLGIITNGTIIPSDDILETMRKYEVGVSISDYTAEVDYKKKLKLLCEKLQNYGITFVRNADIDWFDFGFPNNTYHYNNEEAKKHMRACNTVCHTLDDGKIFYCGTAWAAYRAGLFPLHDNDYVSLRAVDPKDIYARAQILEHCLGNVNNGYLEFCKVCGGYGNDNKNDVVAGKQL